MEALARLASLRSAQQIDPDTSGERKILETERLESALTRFHDDFGLANVLALRGLFLFYVGHTARALETFERAAQAATRAGNVRAAALVLRMGVGARLYGPTPVSEAIASAESAAALAVDPTTKSLIWQKRALLEAMRGDFVAARSFYSGCKELAYEYGLRLRQGVLTQDGAEVELRAGYLVAAEVELREGVRHPCRSRRQRLSLDQCGSPRRSAGGTGQIRRSGGCGERCVRPHAGGRRRDAVSRVYGSGANRHVPETSTPHRCTRVRPSLSSSGPTTSAITRRR